MVDLLTGLGYRPSTARYQILFWYVLMQRLWYMAAECKFACLFWFKSWGYLWVGAVPISPCYKSLSETDFQHQHISFLQLGKWIKWEKISLRSQWINSGRVTFRSWYSVYSTQEPQAERWATVRNSRIHTHYSVLTSRVKERKEAGYSAKMEPRHLL